MAHEYDTAVVGSCHATATGHDRTSLQIQEGKVGHLLTLSLSSPFERAVIVPPVDFGSRPASSRTVLPSLLATPAVG